MADKLIFITGATGFIGSQVVDVTLNAGYRVRLGVRKPEQIQSLKELFAPFSKELEFFVVPDITKADAFEDLLDGVEYIFHLASPMPGKGSDVKIDYVDPAVRGTESIMKAANASPSVRRVIIMSSVLALIPMGGMGGKDIVVKEDSGMDLTVDLDMNFPDGSAGHGLKYRASKILAHQASQTFVTKHRPHFDLVTLHPTFVLGRSLIQKSPKDIDGINSLFWASLHSEKPLVPSLFVHVRDVAEAHLKALDSPIEGGTEFLLSGPTHKWDDVVALMKADYPKVNVKLQPPFDVPFQVDVSRAEKVLGMRWRSIKDMVGDILDQQLVLRSGL